ncbi:MAG: hypothetical protein M1118_11370 [Chloroflexi bacterium]|nr:hypothetical protein [Chloroflexota bacterium]
MDSAGSLLTSSFLGQDIARGTQANCVVVFDAQKDVTPAVVALSKQANREYVVFPDAAFNPLNQAGSVFARAAGCASAWASPSAGTTSIPRTRVPRAAPTDWRSIARASDPPFGRMVGVAVDRLGHAETAGEDRRGHTLSAQPGSLGQSGRGKLGRLDGLSRLFCERFVRPQGGRCRRYGHYVSTMGPAASRDRISVAPSPPR